MFCINVALVLVAIGTFEITTAADKRTYEDDFNVLINLYKLNPLRKSTIFRSYYDSLLMPDINKPTMSKMSDSETFTTETPTNATDKKAQETESYIRNIEKIIHVKNSEHTDPDKSRFEINDNFIEKVPETFNDRTEALNDVMAKFATEMQTKKREDDYKNINLLFEHVDSDEAEKPQTTKLMPVTSNKVPTQPKENKKITLIDVLSNGDYFLG